ncbi:MAG: zinc-dependent metalloprotease, partial [Actinomycetota bacterium]
MDEMEPGDLAVALSKIPLFREVQRLLFSQTGPVNWEIARQIARAVAQAGESTATPSLEERAAFNEACRISELQVAGCTGLEPPTTLARAEILDRVAWADINLEGFRHLIDRLALRLQGELHKAKGPALGLGPVMDAIGPFLLGLEIGFLVGYLSRRVLGQYDLCLPRGEAGRLYFVYPNIASVERELEVDPAQFRLWVALHEVTHRLEFESVPWVRNHFVGLVERFVDAAELDSSEVMARLSSLTNLDELQRLLTHPE